MRWLFSVILSLGLMVQSPAHAGDDADVRETITAQLDAFVRDDFGRAFTYASPKIKRIFRTPDTFGTMVRQGYPMVWRPADFTFLSVEKTPWGMSQIIEIIDQSGVAHYLRYDMVPSNTGWKIDGVAILQGNPMAV